MGMQWEQLTSVERFRYSPVTTSDSTRVEPHISVFQKDAQRIIYSTPFRRLQGKTQVHPFPIFDYLRTRLTHTIEVGNIGRIIANGIGKELLANKEIKDESAFGDIVYAACLTHDLGNPPFGHVGEYAIQSWFEQKAEKSPLVKQVLGDENVKNDFLHFDGNAQGFRIVTRLAGWRDAGGLQLTNATIGAMCKYPCPSIFATPEKKKFGFHFDEAEYARRIFEQLGMQSDGQGRYNRHPFAFLVEAADDICYLTTDIEDAFRAGHVSYNTASVVLEGICKKGDFLGRIAQISDREPQDKIAYLRSGAISSLIVAAIETFLNERSKILSGTYSGNLIETSLYADFIKQITTICKDEVYTERRKIETETAGINVISNLLDLFGDMIIEFKQRGSEKLNSKNNHMYHLLPSNIQIKLKNASNYQSLLNLVDYISGMTDRYALDLFAKLTGGSPTLGRML